MSNKLLSLIIVVLVVIATVFALSSKREVNYNPWPSPKACTMEAKMCPDGSYVGRTGPNCEFAVCLNVINSNSQNSENNTPNPGPNPVKPVGETVGCYVGGCSGQLCSGSKDVVSTCEYRKEYGCYKTAKCERQASGQCGWTQTAELKSCIQSSSNSEVIVY